MDRSPGLRTRVATTVAASLLLCTTSSDAQTGSGSVAHGLAGAVTARAGAGAESNPATIDHRRTLRGEGTTLPGGLAGLSDGALTATLPIDSLVDIGLSIGGIAYGPFSELELSGGVAATLAPAFRAGAALRCVVQSIERYGSAASIELDLGVVATLAPGIVVGMSGRNVGGSSLRDLPRPQRLGLGLLFGAADSLDIALDVQHESGRGAMLASGAALRLAQGIELRAGVGLVVMTFAAGAGYDDGATLVDMAIGWSEGIGARISVAAGMRW